MKRILCILLVLLMLPMISLAELQMETVSNSRILFPELDQMKARFRTIDEWTIVHKDNLDEHMDLLLKRGDSEADIRARFAEDTLLFEAYFVSFPDDACIRVERFVNDTTRDTWHFRHLTTSGRKEFQTLVNDAKLFPQYDTYSAKWEGNGGTSYIACSYTTVPPAAHESGKMCIRLINGQAYVATYAVRERMAGRSNLRSKRENTFLTGYTLLDEMRFDVDLLPKLTAFELDEAFPLQADLGDVTIKGTITKGGKLRVTLDGQEITSKVTSSGAFTVTLPLTEAGDHEVVFTATHSKYTDRTETFTVNASALRTPLTITSQPEEYALAGDQIIAGVSDPGAEIILRLDDREAVTLIADENGAFTHTYEVMDDQVHLLYIAAAAPGKDISIVEIPFITEYETFKDGTKAFEKNLTEQPSVIIADEATAMLDPSGRKEVLKTIKRLNREKGITVVWITHFMEEAAQADRIVVMNKGTTVLSGTPREVFEQVETLREIHLDVPHMTDLSQDLRKEGMPLPAGILTVEEMAEEVCKLLCPSK